MKKLILLFFFLIPFLSFSQKEDHVWIMGYGDGTDSLFTTFTMDFNFDPPVLERRLQDFSFKNTHATICDSLGDLLLYTNGVHLKNQFDEIVINGEEFQSSFSYPIGFPVNQGALFLPIPKNNNQQILFLGDVFIFDNPNTGNLTTGVNPFTYSLIEESGGVIEVTEKKEILLVDTLEQGQFTASKHGNGRDWWILAQGFDNNEYHRFLLSEFGVESIGSQVVGDTVISGLGQTAFSPDGNWYVKNNVYGYINGSLLRACLNFKKL